MIGFHLKVRYYTRERSFIQMNTHIFQGSLNHISRSGIYFAGLLGVLKIAIIVEINRDGGCSPTLCVPSFKNNTWNLKLGGSFDNTLCTNPKENSTK